jgi:hypothetical protein
MVGLGEDADESVVCPPPAVQPVTKNSAARPIAAAATLGVAPHPSRLARKRAFTRIPRFPS